MLDRMFIYYYQCKSHVLIRVKVELFKVIFSGIFIDSLDLAVI